MVTRRYIELFILLSLTCLACSLISSVNHTPIVSIPASVTLMRYLGIASSIIGLWLTGVGVIGKARLGRWDFTLHQWLSKGGVRFWLEAWDEKMGANGSGGLLGMVALVLILLSCAPILLDIQFVNLNLSRYFPILSTVQQFLNTCWWLFLVYVILGVEFAPYVFSLLVWLMLLPYLLVRFLDDQNALERALVLVGLVMGSAGIILSGV